MLSLQCPLSPKIDFEELARRFDFTSGSISSAIVRGAAKVSDPCPPTCHVNAKTIVYKRQSLEEFCDKKKKRKTSSVNFSVFWELEVFLQPCPCHVFRIQTSKADCRDVGLLALFRQASLRSGKDNVLTYQDLIEAAEAEKAHFRDEISEFLLSAYI